MAVRKLSDDHVMRIMTDHKCGQSVATIASKYSVDEKVIRRILAGEGYAEITGIAKEVPAVLAGATITIRVPKGTLVKVEYI